MTTLKFNKLPEDCVQLIFNRVPTQTLLLNIRLVCQHWNSQQKLNCRTRKTLMLVCGGESAKSMLVNSRFERNLIPHRIDQDGQKMQWNAYFDRNQVKICTITPETANILVNTFPNVRTLILAHHQLVAPGTNNHFVWFLSNYSQQLRTLKLYLRYENSRSPQPPAQHIDQIVKGLNSLSLLEHLTLEWTNPMVRYEPMKEDLKFLSWIKQLNCFMPMMPRVWFDYLSELGDDGQLEKVGFESIDYQMSPNTLEINPWPMPGRFTHFPSTSWISSPISLESVVQFPSLRTLNIDGDLVPKSFTEFSRSLATLTKLAHIQLQLNDRWLSIEQPVNPNSQLQQSSSVKAIDLVFHGKIELRKIYPSMNTLSSIFPNVQTIRFVDLREKSFFWMSSYSQEDNMEGSAIAFLTKLKPIFGQHIRTLYSNGDDYGKF